MNTANPPKADFDQRYQTHLKHLKLKGLQPKTIDAYSRAIRRMGDYFDFQIDNLSPAQLTDYFSDLIGTHSWSAVKLDLYGLKFYTLHVLGKPWAMCAARAWPRACWPSAAAAMSSAIFPTPADTAIARIASTLRASAGLSGKPADWWQAATFLSPSPCPLNCGPWPGSTSARCMPS